MPLDQNQMAIVGNLRDLTAGLSPESDPFLYYLPRFLEYNILAPTALESYLAFVKSAVSREPSLLVKDALLIVNQIVSSEDGSLIPPNPVMVENNSHFQWGELGGFTDSKSVILHLINKTALVLNLGRK